MAELIDKLSTKSAEKICDKFTEELDIDKRYSITLYVEERNPKISTNTSDLYYKFTATKSAGGGYHCYDEINPIKVLINGKAEVNEKISYDFSKTTPATIVLASGTVEGIEHDSDGSKIVKVSAYFKDAANSRGSATVDGSLTLTQLHKAPIPFVETVSERNTSLWNLGVGEEEFVNYASSKYFDVDAITYDDATITNYKVSNGNISVSSPNSPLRLDFLDYPLTVENGKVKIDIEVTDSMGGIGKTTVYYDKYIPYKKPSFVLSNLKTPRDGQLTGKAKLIANGTYYNGIVGTQNITPKLEYRVIDRETNKYIIDYQELIPNYQDGKWNIEADIGSDVITNINWFDPEKSYDVEVFCSDELINAVPEIVPQCYYCAILPGEAIMTKFKNRVDFKKLTIRNIPIELFYSSGDVIEIGQNSDFKDYIASGYVTSSTTKICFSIVTPKKLDNITNITCNNCNITARGIKGYVNGESGYHEFKDRSGYTITCMKVSSNIINVVIEKTSAYTNVTNNTWIAVNGYFKFTLS